MFSTIVEKKTRKKLRKTEKITTKGRKHWISLDAGVLRIRSSFLWKKKTVSFVLRSISWQNKKNKKSFLDRKIFQTIHIIESINKNCGIKNYFILT